MTTLRRSKWTPPPPPTPRILQLPRRTIRRKPPSRKPLPVKQFDQESVLSYNVPPVVLLNAGMQDRVEEGECTSGDVEERDVEKWRFQAEMLRAECYLLRMERDVFAKNFDFQRCLLQKSLMSAVNKLVSGKKRIEEGEKASLVIEEEIEELSKTLIELQRSSSRLKCRDVQKCSNFDKKASELQKQLEQYDEMNHGVEEVKDLSGNSLSIDCTTDRKIKVYGSSDRRSIRPTDLETLRRKMERLSKGKLLKRMEEVYGSLLSATNSSLPSSASSSRRYDLADLISQSSQEAKSGELKACSGQCKAIVKRLMEQVKAETEQWSQMQEMLGQVREEMEDLQASRDFWEARALDSDHQVQTLHCEVDEWKQKTASFNMKEKKLHKRVQDLQQKLEKLSVEETCEVEVKLNKDAASISLGAHLAKEKRGLTCRVKERGQTNVNMKKQVMNDNSRVLSSSNWLPFKDISNLSPLESQNSRRYVYPLHNSVDS